MYISNAKFAGAIPTYINSSIKIKILKMRNIQGQINVTCTVVNVHITIVWVFTNNQAVIEVGVQDADAVDPCQTHCAVLRRRRCRLADATPCAGVFAHYAHYRPRWRQGKVVTMYPPLRLPLSLSLLGERPRRWILTFVGICCYKQPTILEVLCIR